MKFSLESLSDSYLYKLINESLDERARELFNILLEKTYQQGKLDLVHELKPDVIIRHGIFAKNRDKGIEKIKELTKDKIKVTERYGKNEVLVETIDSIYKLIPFNDGARGHKLHYAYVDKELLQSKKDNDMLNCRVVPMLVLADMHFGKDEGYSYKNHLVYY